MVGAAAAGSANEIAPMAAAPVSAAALARAIRRRFMGHAPYRTVELRGTRSAQNARRTDPAGNSSVKGSACHPRRSTSIAVSYMAALLVSRGDDADVIECDVHDVPPDS